MTELRGLAQHADELEQRKVKVVAISVDDQEHAHDVMGESRVTEVRHPL
jgi:alkyl hydroperoxide reductase subunit AhpC